MNRPRTALVHVQHLLGTGHVVRAAAIGRALVQRGIAVTLACGNTPPPTLDTSGLEIVPLPAVRSRDAEFSVLVDEHDVPIDDAWRQRRAASTLELFEARQPDILLTETYPLGRRLFAFEMNPLLTAATRAAQRPLIAASVRDILVRKQDARKEAEMAARARAAYDAILVHSDPDIVRLEDSFPPASTIADLLRYTGFVHTGRTLQPPADDGVDEIIVSCGGGAVGARLLHAALDARPLSGPAAALRWRLLVGHDLSDEQLATLQRAPGPGMIVERARPDFPGLLKRARLSISQAGYNTVLDILAAGLPAVLVPFAQARETEQTQRAAALAARRLAVLCEEDGLTSARLARAVRAAWDLPAGRFDAAMNGAARSAEILIGEWQGRR